MITYLNADPVVSSNEDSATFDHNEQYPVASSTSHSEFKGDCQMRSSSFGAVGCLKYVEDFEILETLGRGFFGVVYKVREKRPNDCKSRNHPPIVMKEPVISVTQSNLCAKKIVSREYHMLRLLKHPNILKTRGVCIQQNELEWNFRLLVDYCDGGSVQEVTLNLQKPFHWFERLHLALDICKGMDFCHRRGFMHRDLTANNVLLQKASNSPWRKAVVADFGLSCRIPRPPEIKQQVGTQWYMAPEMLNELFYNEKADVYSFGIILCQMIARIDADHDAGLYRTSKFGLDYVRFAAHCPSDTPLEMLKTAFMCCLLEPTSRPSFEDLVKQLNRIIVENFPKNSTSFDDTSRLGRSHSDATIISSSSITTLNGRRLFRPDQLVIPEGVPVDENFPSTPSENELDDRIKQLAVTIAAEDPDYQESSLNPFASHHRYRSIRKMKPAYYNRKENEDELNGDSIKNTEEPVAYKDETGGPRRKSRRSRSMPVLSSSPVKNNSRSPLSRPSKRSITLGLGEQRDLQGHIVATFRKFDQNFTNISKSGILLSTNDLSRVSNESLDKSILPDESEDDEENSSLSDEAVSTDESLPPKPQIVKDTTSGQTTVSTSSDRTTTFHPKQKSESGRHFLRKPSDECRIL